MIRKRIRQTERMSYGKRFGVLTMAMMMGLSTAYVPFTTQAATEHFNDAAYDLRDWNNWKADWTAYSTDYEKVSLTPGADQSSLNFAWYSKTTEVPKVRIAKTKRALEAADAYEGVQDREHVQTIDEIDYMSNKVTVSGLEENTNYYYQVFCDGKWQEVNEYTTKSFTSFSFLYVGDPQIGASKGQTTCEGDKLNEAPGNLAARNDGYNWNKVLEEAVGNHDKVSFLVSAGDQVNTANNEVEYAAYLGAQALRSLPVATTIGNHDSGNLKYSLHFNNPNTFAEEETDYTTGKTAAGTDYYFRYGNTLFIMIDTNNYNCATHENVIKKAVAENEDAKWRVVTFHQDIYGSGLDHSDSDGMVLRTQLTLLMDKYDIDVVLQGHDHTYSRTYQLTSDGMEHVSYDKSNYIKGDPTFLAENAACYAIQSDVVNGSITNPEGTVYLEANSATGSKYYNLIPSQQDYIAERSQTWTPSYSVIDVDDTHFTVNVYDASTGRKLSGSSSYTIIKEEVEEIEEKVPETVILKKVTSNKKNQLTVSWKKNTKVDGFQIAYSTSKAFKKNVKKINVTSNKTAVKTIKSLRSHKKYYVKVRAYYKNESQKVFGKYSEVKGAKVR